MAEHAHTTPAYPSRRTLFGAAALLALATPARAEPVFTMKIPSADAELIRVCGEFIAACQQYEALYDGPDAIEDDEAVAIAAAPITALCDVQVDEMERLRATTAEGIQARAAALAADAGHGDYSFDGMRDGDDVTGRLLRYLLRDAAALGGIPLPEQLPAHPDAEIVAICGEFDVLEQAFCATNFRAAPNTPEDEAAQAEQSRIADAQGELVNRITEFRATTMAGHAARARSLANWDAELLKDGPGDVGACLTAALVRDLIGSAI